MFGNGAYQDLNIVVAATGEKPESAVAIRRNIQGFQRRDQRPPGIQE